MAKKLAGVVLAFCTVQFSRAQFGAIMSSICHRSEEGGYHCSGRGACGPFGCECYEGFFGPSCSKKHCPKGVAWSDVPHAEDEAHQMAMCSNKGSCEYETGKCDCDKGFKGSACDILACPGQLSECNGRGICVPLREYTNVIYGMEYSEMWDADKIFGCICNFPYTGYDCSIRQCPMGDDPETENQLDTTQIIKCDLSNDEVSKTYFHLGWKGNAGYKWQYSPRIYWSDTAHQVEMKLNSIAALGHVEVDFLASGIYTACAGMEVVRSGEEPFIESPQFIRVKFRQDYGDLEPLRVRGPDDDAIRAPLIAVACDSDNIHFPCAASKWVFGINSYIPVKGTKESLECSGRGQCDYTIGVCSCHFQSPNGDYRSSDGMGNPGERGDCGYQFQAVFQCDYTKAEPSTVDCSGHGTCANDLLTSVDNSEIYCACHDNWYSYNCLKRRCPLGEAWFGAPAPDIVDPSLVGAHGKAECSNRGVCDAVNGICFCQEGFEGAACEIMSCTKSFDVNGLEISCSGHGNCHSLGALGKLHGISYGAVPHNPRVWDHDQIHGCLCDEGWSGYDCNYRNCPHGDHVHADGSMIADMECSGNGDCDSVGGICNCYHGYTASDGQGHQGYIPDCGFYVPMQKLINLAGGL